MLGTCKQSGGQAGGGRAKRQGRLLAAQSRYWYVDALSTQQESSKYRIVRHTATHQAAREGGGRGAPGPLGRAAAVLSSLLAKHVSTFHPTSTEHLHTHTSGPLTWMYFCGDLVALRSGDLR